MEPRLTRVTVLKTAGLKHARIAEALHLSSRSVEQYVRDARNSIEKELRFERNLSEAVAWRQAGLDYLGRHYQQASEQLHDVRPAMNKVVLPYFEGLFPNGAPDAASRALRTFDRERVSLDALVQAGLYSHVLRMASRLHGALRPFKDSSEMWIPLFEVQGFLIMGLANAGRVEDATRHARERLELAKSLGKTDEALALRDLGSVYYANSEFEPACESLLASKKLLSEADEAEWGLARSRLSSEIASSLARVNPKDPRIARELNSMRRYPSPEHIYTELEIALLRDDLAKTKEILSRPQEAVPLDVSGEALVSLSRAMLAWKLGELPGAVGSLARAQALIEQAGLQIMKPHVETFARQLERVQETGRRTDFDPVKEIILFSMHRLQPLRRRR